MGGVPDDTPVSWYTNGDPDLATVVDQYGPLKATCERICAKAFPAATLILRPGYIVGPWDGTGACGLSRISAVSNGVSNDSFLHRSVALAAGGNTCLARVTSGRWIAWAQRVAQGGEVLGYDRETPMQWIDVPTPPNIHVIKSINSLRLGLFYDVECRYGTWLTSRSTAALRSTRMNTISSVISIELLPFSIENAIEIWNLPMNSVISIENQGFFLIRDGRHTRRPSDAWRRVCPRSPTRAFRSQVVTTQISFMVPSRRSPGGISGSHRLWCHHNLR